MDIGTETYAFNFVCEPVGLHNGRDGHCYDCSRRAVERLELATIRTSDASCHDVSIKHVSSQAKWRRLEMKGVNGILMRTSNGRPKGNAIDDSPRHCLWLWLGIGMVVE